VSGEYDRWEFFFEGERIFKGEGVIFHEECPREWWGCLQLIPDTHARIAYKSLRATVVICATLFNTHTYTHRRISNG